jgi:hypothetical protein
MKRTAYGPRPTARRSTPFELEKLLADTLAIIDGSDDRISIRHLFYRLVSRGSIPKTETAYKGLRSHLTKWRRACAVRWKSFTDNTRWHIKTRTFDDMREALDETVSTYRRTMWATQPFYVEAWVEKAAIAGMVSGVADSFGVPTFVCRGNASLTSLHNAAETFKDAAEKGKRPLILYLGDHDPSGLCIDKSAHTSLRDDFGVEVDFRRIVVTPAQIADLSLQTRPVKLTDSRARGWQGGCVEVDAIEPATIKELVRDAITGLVDAVAWASLRQVEEMERETLRATLIQPEADGEEAF